MFMKKPSHRVFDYTPRFYKPDEDESERRKRRLGFRRHRTITKRKKTTNPLIWGFLILVVIYIIFKLEHLV